MPTGKHHFLIGNRSEVSTADKTALVDTVYGTNLNARATSGTEIVVDGSEVILNGDRAVRTGLLTLHTADTAVGAVLAHVCALVVVGAFNDHAYGIVEKMDNAVGTLAYANATADTLLGIDASYVILNGNGVLRADLGTVSVAEAGEGAELVAAVRHICGTAGLLSLVVVLLQVDAAGTVAGYECNLLNDVLCLNAEDGCDILCGSVTAGNTEIGLVGGLFRKSLCISVTSGVAASSAVCTGQTVTDSNCSLVLLYCKERGGNRKKHRAKKRDSKQNKNGN